MVRKLTIGMILSVICITSFLLWALSTMVNVAIDPTNPNNVAKAVAEGGQMIVDESTPTIFSIIIGITTSFGGTLFAAMLIVVALFGWSRIEDFNILPFVEDIIDYFSDGQQSL